MAYSQQAGTSGAGPGSMQEEFTVRIPRDKRKAFTMMKFGTSSTVDFSKMGEQPVKIERENNLKEYKSANDLDLLPKFGAGSEYGRELKEESRRKKYGIMLKRYNPEDQPLILKLGAGKQGKRYKGVKEGTIAENTSYYIFTKAGDGAFEAFPVGEWYNFTPIVKYKYLNSDEAEEEFTRRDKTLNFFNIMLKKRLRKEDDKDLDDDDDGGKKKKGKKKGSRNMILTDMDDWNDLDLSDDDDEEEEDNDMSGPKKKNSKTKRKSKTTKNSKKNSDDEAIEESDEGDYDDREVDYISDSESSDGLSGPETEERDKNQEKGVDEEKGLRNILDSDAEDEEEEEEKEEVEDETEEKDEKKEEKAKKGDDSSSSSSDDDSDIEKNVDSAIFMQRDKNVKKETTETEGKDTEVSPQASGEKKDKDKADKGVKRKGEKSPDGKALPSKKHKSDDSAEAMMEEAIRRYLTRKPMTTKDLLQKFRAKKLNMTNDQITHTIAQLLKKLNPDKTTINKKLYLSLKKPE